MEPLTAPSLSIALIQSGQPFSLPAGQGAVALLGRKGAGLNRLAQLQAPIPPAFVITAPQVAALYQALHQNQFGQVWSQLSPSLREGLAELARLGGVARELPLLFSLRVSPVESPAPNTRKVKTAHNLGITPAGAEALEHGPGLNQGFGYDVQARFLAGWAQHVLGDPPDRLEALIQPVLDQEGAEEMSELSPKAKKRLAEALAAHCAQSAKPPPEAPLEQLKGMVLAFLDELEGPAAFLIQLMVFGNAPGPVYQAAGLALDGFSGSLSGACHTRHPATGQPCLPPGGVGPWHGRAMAQAYGSDLTAGLRLDMALHKAPGAAVWGPALAQWGEKLEGAFHDALEISFTVEAGRFFLLKARSAGRTPEASLVMAQGLQQSGRASSVQALQGLDPNFINRYLHPILDPQAEKKLFAKGLPVSPGSAVGQVVFFADQAEELAAQGITVILARQETSPEDMGGLQSAKGIITATGGPTSHAAVVARGMGKCCIVGAQEIQIDYQLQQMTTGGVTVKRRDWISMDGNTGEIFLGQLAQQEPQLTGQVEQVLEWADQARRLKVLANADTPADARQAVKQGAQGIGLCRTEHMFFHPERLPYFRKMILAGDEGGRLLALKDLEPLQREDFEGLLKEMDGRPVTIRLLDPPLHEFLPKEATAQARMAQMMDLPVEVVRRRAEKLMEANPMLGHRGCRLAITYPEIYQMQARAIVQAACRVAAQGIKVHPEIMIPLVSHENELKVLRKLIEPVVRQTLAAHQMDFAVPIGTMIETPRAALRAGRIALHADFFSFGTNDLTQMTFGFSRDDSNSFLPFYLVKGVLPSDPFVELDQHGVGALVAMAVQNGRAANPNLTIGICGEHGGDPSSVQFSHLAGLDYVSCSPYRIPVARLAAGRAAVLESEHP